MASYTHYPRRNNGSGGTSGFDVEGSPLLTLTAGSSGVSSLWDYASSSSVPNLTAPDFNGDGRADFLHTWKEQIFGFPADPECPDPFYMNYYFEVASGEASYSDFEWIQLTCEEIVNLKILGINGDGLTDLLYRKQTPVTFSSVWFVRRVPDPGCPAKANWKSLLHMLL